MKATPDSDVIYKPADSPAVEAAKQTKLGRVYPRLGNLDRRPRHRPGPVAGMDPPRLPAGRSWTTVEFTDLRFAYSFLPSSSRQQPSPLRGWVYIVDGDEDAGEKMGGRAER